MRSIIVNDKEYRFKIGKRFTKVMNPKNKVLLFENIKFARDIAAICGCCGVSFAELHPSNPDKWDSYKIVTKRSVRSAILHNNF